MYGLKIISGTMHALWLNFLITPILGNQPTVLLHTLTMQIHVILHKM